MVIQGVVVVAVQAQVLEDAVTVTEPGPPAGVAEAVVGLMAKVHPPAGDCTTDRVWSATSTLPVRVPEEFDDTLKAIGPGPLLLAFGVMPIKSSSTAEDQKQPACVFTVTLCAPPALVTLTGLGSRLYVHAGPPGAMFMVTL